jgi:AraC family transcriptional regulator
MTRVLGAGDFVAWDGGCMLIGQAYLATGVHSHYAMQFSFGADDGICFRPSETDDWTPYAGVVIASRQPHAMDASVIGVGATMLVEQETPAGRALEARFGANGITAIERATFSTAAQRLFATWEVHRGGSETAVAAQAALNAVAGDTRPAVVSDERVLRVIAFINENLSQTLTLDSIAREAFLSPTRFRHLFVEQTGTALRPYVLWRRFLKSWSLVRDGAALSAAAHEAGFADAAHLTRTSQRMFGFAPSALLIGQRGPGNAEGSSKTAAAFKTR